MSENLDLVRSIYADWEQEAVSTWWLDPDVEYVIVDGPQPGRGKGATALEDVFREFDKNWLEYRIVPIEYRELGDGRVFVVSRVTARGMSSGAFTEQDRASLFEIQAGKVVTYVVWWDLNRALADLGLEE